MELFEARLTLPTAWGDAPLLAYYHPNGLKRAVLVYHGLSACKEVQEKELRSLAAAGFLAVGVDACGHGERKEDGLHFLEMVARSIDEVPALVDGLAERFAVASFGLTGISMGGYVAFAAPLVEPRLRAVVPILGSPRWGEGPRAGRSPHLHRDGYPGVALLAMNAGRDVNVPPHAAREFVHGLARPRAEYLEFPESEHFMREEDWNDLWTRTVRWFDAYL